MSGPGWALEIFWLPRFTLGLKYRTPWDPHVHFGAPLAPTDRPSSNLFYQNPAGSGSPQLLLAQLQLLVLSFAGNGGFQDAERWAHFADEVRIGLMEVLQMEVCRDALYKIEPKTAQSWLELKKKLPRNVA